MDALRQLFFIVSATFVHVNGECGHYANSPLDTCLGGSSVSNYYYCNGSNFLYWKQYANADCSEPAAYDQPLCDTNDETCIASCDPEPCEYVLFVNYGASPCDKATSDYNEAAYITNYCHQVSGSTYNSAKYQCSGNNEMTYTQYTDDSCVDEESTSTVSMDAPIETECMDTLFEGVNCTEAFVDPNENIACAVYDYRPLEICEGHYDPSSTSYSNYYYCDANGWLNWKQYASTDCSGTAASETALCDSAFSDCPTRCGSQCTDYFTQKFYGSGGQTSCDKASESWNEVTYPIGYCVSSTSTSLKAECDGNGGLIYTSYSGAGCDVQLFNVTIPIVEVPQFQESDSCLDTTIYAPSCLATTTEYMTTMDDGDLTTTELVAETTEMTTTEQGAVTIDDSGVDTYLVGFIAAWCVAVAFAVAL